MTMKEDHSGLLFDGNYIKCYIVFWLGIFKEKLTWGKGCFAVAHMVFQSYCDIL